MSKFKQQATQEYDASYNQKVQTLKNQLAQNTQSLDQQKGGVNSNYDLQVGNQNLSNKKSKNNISNTALGRGLSNSSIVTSGLAEADQINNRLVGNINRERTGALNDIEAQKALLAQNMQGTLGTMSADRLDGISNLARQLEDRDFDKSHQNNQLALQRESMLADQQYKNLSLAQQKELANAQLAWDKEKLAQQLALDRERIYASGSGSGGSGEDPNLAYNEYLAQYYSILNDDNLTEAQKKTRINNMGKEMKLYGTKNGVNLNDLSGMALGYGEGQTIKNTLNQTSQLQQRINDIGKEETKKKGSTGGVLKSIMNSFLPAGNIRR